MVRFVLRRPANVQHHHFGIGKASRQAMKGHRPGIVWFTGLPAAGKSTIMNLVEEILASRGTHTYALDGDNLREGLNRDLGFTDADRVENIRRAGEAARLMVDAGLLVLCAFVSPFRAERRVVRELVEPDEFIEVLVDTPLDVCIARDPKGLYEKAHRPCDAYDGYRCALRTAGAARTYLHRTAGNAQDLAKQVVALLMERELLLAS